MWELGSNIDQPVSAPRPNLKLTLKRGALVAAANWPVILVQATADSLLKLVIAAPVIGGVFLMALIVGAEPSDLMTEDWRDMITIIIGALLSHPLVLAAFLLAVAVVVVGGSLFIFLVKAGTVSVLVRAEREAGAIEQPPLHVSSIAGASRYSADLYVESARALFPRYARLGFILMAVYLTSAAAYLVFVVTSRLAGESWGITALVTGCFVAWITVVNLLYLLVQIIVAADDCSVASASRRVAAFLRHERRNILAVFLIILALVVVATGASLLATAALGLIAFVPFFGFTVLPLQLLAWLLRGIVFQYIGLTSIGAYLNLYRAFTTARAAKPARAESVGAPAMGHTGS
jgi:hypothetical protein